MKYKCIKDQWIEDIKIMSEGDIIVVSEDKNQIYNLTSRIDIRNISIDQLLPNLINVSDEYMCKKHPFQNITNEMFKTYLRKNRDYGNSFDQSLDKWGLSVAAIRLGDKLNRFESFVKNGSFSVNDEGVLDTLSDMATYAIMTIMYLNNDNKKV